MTVIDFCKCNYSDKLPFRHVDCLAFLCPLRFQSPALWSERQFHMPFKNRMLSLYVKFTEARLSSSADLEEPPVVTLNMTKEINNLFKMYQHVVCDKHKQCRSTHFHKIIDHVIYCDAVILQWDGMVVQRVELPSHSSRIIVCVEPCSPEVHMCFFPPPPPKDMLVGGLVTLNCLYVWMCVVYWYSIQSVYLRYTQCFQDRLWLYHDSDKVLTEDKQKIMTLQ